MWWIDVMLSQAAADPVQKLVESNPIAAAIVSSVTLLVGADKVAFWMSKRRRNGHSEPKQDNKNLEALVDTQKDLGHTMVEVSKTLGRLEEYCQRHFETNSLEMRSVREELRAIRERMRSTDGPSRSQ